MQKPNRNFLMDMLFGLAKGKSVILSDIAKTLEEPIDTIQTVKRLSTRLEDFHEDNTLMSNYGELLAPHVNEDDNLIIVDNSEIIKPYSKKLEGLGDRKSTRLNSSHVANSYASFCSNKKQK